MTTGTAPALEHDYAALTERSGPAGPLGARQARRDRARTPPSSSRARSRTTWWRSAPGQGCYAALLDPKAHILADMRILSAGPAELWLDTEPRRARRGAAAPAHVQDRPPGRDLRPHGRARDPVAARARVGRGRRPRRRRSRSRPPSTSGSTARVGDLPRAGSRRPAPASTSVTPREAADAPARRAGRGGSRSPSATRRPRCCGSSAGSRATASTWAPDNLPGEAGIVERAVSFTKGCYVGQEPVARMYHRGRPTGTCAACGCRPPSHPGSR